MRNGLLQAGLLGIVLAGSGCYHAQIETGAIPSDIVVREDMATSWLWGLVPPKLMNVERQCASGVSRVETEHSILNGLLHILTGGIFTPMTIIVTCAKGGAAMAVPDGASVVGYDAKTPGGMAAAIQQAARLAHQAHAAVYVTSR